MPYYDTFLFHGSAIAVDGVGYLFTAKSGTGKSTHARLWRELLGARAVMVNDDKPLLRVTEGRSAAPPGTESTV
jgi:serine kinase of HPr protein (carbohydrate metabolism regulator)